MYVAPSRSGGHRICDQGTTRTPTSANKGTFMPESRRNRADGQYDPIDDAAPGGDNRGQARTITSRTGSEPDLTLLLAHEPRVEPLDAEERRIADLIAELYDAGCRVAVQCKTCGSWISDPRSVARHQGPVCASREGAPR